MRVNYLKSNFTNLVILLVFITGIWLRSSLYGDMRLSVGNFESISYINSSQAPLLSWKIFSGTRLFTTNIIYKVANDEQHCPMTAFSAPALGQEDFRANQPCFNKIAVFQNLLAIFGWTFLAWVTAKRIQNPITKIISSATIMLFGFTPQIAEWESVLSPESLSLSLFAITLGLTIECAFLISASKAPFKSSSERLLLTICITSFLVWVFVRDVHLYAIPIAILSMIPFLFINKYRHSTFPAITIIILFVFFIIGFISARDGLRASRYPVVNAIDAYILPYPTRVEFFKKFGIPERTSPDYQDWADINASKAYGLFLISHPGFVVTTLWEYRDQFSSDFIQPYFFTPEIKYRATLLTIGEMLHPESLVIYLVSVYLLVSLLVHANQFRNQTLSAWAWLAVWVYGVSTMTLLVSFFGDTSGTRRHIMPSVEMFRLFFWIFLMPFLDLSLNKSDHIDH